MRDPAITNSDSLRVIMWFGSRGLVEDLAWDRVAAVKGKWQDQWILQPTINPNRRRVKTIK
jgi:hypothetical protein